MAGEGSTGMQRYFVVVVPTGKLILGGRILSIKDLKGLFLERTSFESLSAFLNFCKKKKRPSCKLESDFILSTF